jgi:hypothetical protein
MNVQTISNAEAQRAQRNQSFFSMTAVQFAEFLKNRLTLVFALRQKKKTALPFIRKTVR